MHIAGPGGDPADRHVCSHILPGGLRYRDGGEADGLSRVEFGDQVRTVDVQVHDPCRDHVVALGGVGHPTAYSRAIIDHDLGLVASRRTRSPWSSMPVVLQRGDTHQKVGGEAVSVVRDRR